MKVLYYPSKITFLIKSGIGWTSRFSRCFAMPRSNPPIDGPVLIKSNAIN
jgi:hypothetical protein